MTVILEYHSLVSRESKYVSKKWKKIIVWLLVLIVMISLAAAFSIQTLFVNFNSNCPIGAHLKFNQTCSSLSMSFIDDSVQTVEECNSTAVRFINEGHSIWGDVTACNYMTFVPIMQSIFACIWFVLFAMCGHGGRGMDSMFAEPWRIVLPAIIFFALMTICSFVHYVIFHRNFNEFCAQLDNQTVRKSRHQRIYMRNKTSCHELIDQFALNSTTDVPAGTNLQLGTAFSVTAATMWLIALIVMVLRILFVVDFQLIRVTVSTVDHHQHGNDTSEEIKQMILEDMAEQAEEDRNAFTRDVFMEEIVIQKADNIDDTSLWKKITKLVQFGGKVEQNNAEIDVNNAIATKDKAKDKSE